MNVRDPNFSLDLMDFFVEKAIEPFHHEQIDNLDIGQEIRFCGVKFEENDCYICSQCAIDHFDRKQAEVNYNCPQRNNIYAIRSMVCHATEISSLLDGTLLQSESDFVDNFFKNKVEVNVASIGYASGTDLLAILRYFSSDKLFSVKKLNVFRIDKNAEKWQESANLTEQFIRENADLIFDFQIKTNELPAKKVDVFILSYILNELNQSEIDEIITSISKSASNKFVIIINEVNKYKFDDSKYFDYTINKIDKNFNRVSYVKGHYPYELSNGRYGIKREYDYSCKYKDIITEGFRKEFAVKLYLQSKFYLAEYHNK